MNYSINTRNMKNKIKFKIHQQQKNITPYNFPLKINKRGFRCETLGKKTKEKKEEIILSTVKIVSKSGYAKATMEEIAAELLMTSYLPIPKNP